MTSKEIRKFEIGKTYENDGKFEVISRTAKYITVKRTNLFGEEEISRHQVYVYEGDQTEVVKVKFLGQKHKHEMTAAYDLLNEEGERRGNILAREMSEANKEEAEKANGEEIKMELVIAGARNWTEMSIVQMNKWGETKEIGAYAVKEETGEEWLSMRKEETKEVSKSFYNARGGISQTTRSKTEVKKKTYTTARYMEKVLAEYGLTLEEVRAAMGTLKAIEENNAIYEEKIMNEYVVTPEAQTEAMVTEMVKAEMAALNRKVDENPDLKMRAAIQKWMPTGKAAEEEKPENAIKESVSEQIAGTIEGLEKIWTANLKKKKKFRQNSMELNLTIKLLEQLRAGARLIERVGVQSDSEIKFKMDLPMKRIVNDLIAKGSSKLKTDCKIKEEADKGGSRLSVKENSIMILAELAYESIKMRIMEAA